MSDFKEGDTVRLKSGGPLMTVTQIGNSSGRPHVWTAYFDDKGEQKSGFYPIGTVEASTKPKGF